MCAKLLFILLFTAGCCFASLSQSSCNGKLLDPVVKVTFGAGPNQGPALQAGTTSYQYMANDCPADGYYTILNKAAGCYYGDWHTVTDHTGDSAGYFMLVNASYDPGVFYVDTVQGLCANSTYEFGAWLLEVDTPTACSSVGLILPNVTFRVERLDGTLIQSYNTGAIPASTTPEWKRYSFFFTTAESNLVLRIINNAPGGCGNDLAMDDITFSVCSPVVLTSISNGPGSTNLCYGIDTTLNFGVNITGNYNRLQYQWQSSNDSGQTWTDIQGANDSTLNRSYPAGTVPGIYLNRVEVAEYPNNINVPQCRIISDTSTIVVQPSPIPSSSSNSPICAGSSLLLSAAGGSTYKWTGPGGFTADSATLSVAAVSENNEGTYVVTVTSEFGCNAYDSLYAVVNIVPDIKLSPAVNICAGTTAQLKANGGGTYRWFPATSLSNDTIPNPVASPAGSTSYTVTVTNQFGCVDTSSVMVNVLKNPVADAGPGKGVILGQSVTLDASVQGDDISYYWTPDMYINSTAELQPSVSPTQDVTYTLHVTSNAGCMPATSSVLVKVYKKVEVPNAFSPNGDGINDTWNIVALQTYSTAELSIFSRSGQMVFHCKGYDKPWDGRYNGAPLPIGTYYYIIDLKNGSPFKSGSVTIIR